MRVSLFLQSPPCLLGVARQLRGRDISTSGVAAADLPESLVFWQFGETFTLTGCEHTEPVSNTALAQASATDRLSLAARSPPCALAAKPQIYIAQNPVKRSSLSSFSHLSTISRPGPTYSDPTQSARRARSLTLLSMGQSAPCPSRGCRWGHTSPTLSTQMASPSSG